MTQTPPYSHDGNHQHHDNPNPFILQPKSIFQSPLSFPQKIAMLSNLSTSYNATNISLVLPLLDCIYPAADDYSDKLVELESILASSLLFGMMAGQLLGGALGDILGRQRALSVVMMLQVVGSLGSSVVRLNHSADINDINNDLGLHIREALVVWRLILGIGAGGVYPLAAVLSAEQDSQSQYDTKPNDSHNRASCDATDIEHSHNSLQEIIFEETLKTTQTSNPMNNNLHADDVNISQHKSNEHENNYQQHNIEQAQNEIHKSKMIALTFSTQGIGFILVPIVTWIVVSMWGEYSDRTWRIVLGLGSVPGIVIFVLMTSHMGCSSSRSTNSSVVVSASDRTNISIWGRLWNYKRALRYRSMKKPTTQQNQSNHDGTNDNDLEEPLTSSGSSSMESSNCHNEYDNDCIVSQELQSRLHSQPQSSNISILAAIRSEPNLHTKLLGTAFTWFIFDILFYGNILFQPVVTEAAFGDPSSSQNENGNQNNHLIQSLARNSFILTLLALPGYFVSIHQLNTQTPRYIQSQGFFCMFVLYGVIGVFWSSLSEFPSLLLGLYGGSFFFANYGPNTTTFMMPSTTFTQVKSRSTLNGIAAACGKLGALVGASLFEPLVKVWGADVVMMVCACVSMGGFVLSRLFLAEPSYGYMWTRRRVFGDDNNDYIKDMKADDKEDKGEKMNSNNGDILLSKMKINEIQEMD